MIHLQNISFGYGKGRPLFCDLSMQLREGYIHGLMGINGTGKTTLLKIICGMIAPKQGTVTINDINPLLHKPSLYKNIFFVPEEFDFPAISFDNFVKSHSVFYPDFSQEALNYYAGNFEVYATKRLDRLSMGQRKKALLCFAMACQTKLLIMDEPTNGLDIPSKLTFRHLVAGYADDRKTVIISTHQVQDIENLIDNVVIVDEKGLLMNKTTEEITEKLFFGVSGQSDGSQFYAQETLKGLYGVSENKKCRESKINLEVLFNAGYKNREKIFEIINGKPSSK